MLRQFSHRMPAGAAGMQYAGSHCSEETTLVSTSAKAKQRLLSPATSRSLRSFLSRSTPLLFAVLLAFFMLSGCQGRALVGDNVHEYLMQFGYLPQSDFETGNLRTDNQLKDALKNLQYYGGIPVTGELDRSTLKLLKTPRCGLPDIPTASFRSKRYTLHGQKWHRTNLTWSLHTPPADRRLHSGQVRRVLGQALKVWEDNSKLTFREVHKDAEADIVVHFFRLYHNDGYPFDGKGQILAHAFFPGSGRGGDAHFDEDEMWVLDDNSERNEGTSLFNVAAHEFGHSLGLSHSSVTNSLMFPWYQGQSSNNKFVLPDDDILGIQQLYGYNGKLWAPFPTYKPEERTTTTTTTTTTPTPRTTRPTPRTPYTRPPYRPPTKTPLPPRQPPTHRPHQPTTPHTRYHPTTPSTTEVTPTPTIIPEKPETCDTEYDAIAVIRRETFVFRSRYFWRIGDKGLMRDYPVEISRFWHGLPRNFTHIDAVYEQPNRTIVFFIGKQYWRFDANNVKPGYPKPISNLGLPRELDHVDGAMVWGHNGKTYFFSGTMYWRFDEETRKVELDYPRDMSMWNGVGYNIDAVFQWVDGITYFFKGKNYWKFNDQKMRTESDSPALSGPFWMGCPTKLEEPIDPSLEENNVLISIAGSSVVLPWNQGLWVLLFVPWLIGFFSI